MKRKNSVRNVQHSILPPLTEEQKAQIASLRVMPDDDIDYGDAPALSDEQWGTALKGRFYKPVKVSKTVRIDADILAWLQRPGKGYQKRLNAVLRAAMLKGQELEE
ncbi:cytoplasmic protein [Serratia proteamaculans]|uniref:BrnA antitoxin family protein n=1 Tax=Serratia proteamaculans TaxID=28151 RepID=UPI001075DAF9|nr:BrnA antitoxin family protein [Serratia proteamaculans]TFZ49332.1 cytoplasmic protein [Serratia proteamaculans]